MSANSSGNSPSSAVRLFPAGTWQAEGSRPSGLGGPGVTSSHQRAAWGPQEARREMLLWSNWLRSMEQGSSAAGPCCQHLQKMVAERDGWFLPFGAVERNGRIGRQSIRVLRKNAGLLYDVTGADVFAEGIRLLFIKDEYTKQRLSVSVSPPPFGITLLA